MRSLVIALLAMIGMCHATGNAYLPPQKTYESPYKVGLSGQINRQNDIIKTTPRPIAAYSRGLTGISGVGRHIGQDNTFDSTSNTYQYGSINRISGVSQSGSYGKPSDGRYRGQSDQGSHGQNIPIISYNSENNGDGNYQFSYETGNGINVQESGSQQGKTEFVSGFFSYTGPDGVQYSISYTADENGFHPEGAHLPTPPPIPPEIQRGVELALAAEARGENQDGSYSYQGGGYGGGGGGGAPGVSSISQFY